MQEFDSKVWEANAKLQEFDSKVQEFTLKMRDDNKYKYKRPHTLEAYGAIFFFNDVRFAKRHAVVEAALAGASEGEGAQV